MFNDENGDGDGVLIYELRMTILDFLHWLLTYDQTGCHKPSTKHKFARYFIPQRYLDVNIPG